MHRLSSVFVVLGSLFWKDNCQEGRSSQLRSDCLSAPIVDQQDSDSGLYVKFIKDSLHAWGFLVCERVSLQLAFMSPCLPADELQHQR